MHRWSDIEFKQDQLDKGSCTEPQQITENVRQRQNVGEPHTSKRIGLATNPKTQRTLYSAAPQQITVRENKCASGEVEGSLSSVVFLVGFTNGRGSSN